jgi:glycosyltransferase involved in cell wall biosynthesis
MFSPLVSIIVPCYNQAHFLNECLNSLVKQTFTNWECIIVDDGSTDQTVVVAKNFCDRDPRFHYHRQLNKGLSGARNTGIKSANGSYLNFLDSDDALYPKALECLVKEIQNDPSLVMVYGGYKGSKETLTSIVKTAISDFDSSRMDFYPYLCAGNALPVHAALVKKEVIDQIGLFDENLKSCEDWDFWLRLARTTNRVKVIRKPVVVYRITSNSMTRNVKTFFDAGITVIERTNQVDERVRHPLEKYKEGYAAAYNNTLISWYAKCMGLYLAQHRVDEAKHLLMELKTTRKHELSEGNFLYAWKQVMFGAVEYSRKEAWRAFGHNFTKFLEFVEEYYQQKGLAAVVLARINYFNAPVYRRAIMKLLGKRKA